jgi:hypothetical protein
VKRKIIVGTVKVLKSKGMAKKALEAMNLNINAEQPKRGPITLSDLVKHYVAAELGPDRKTKTPLTCRVYKWNLKNHILTRWGTRRAETLLATERSVAQNSVMRKQYEGQGK